MTGLDQPFLSQPFVANADSPLSDQMYQYLRAAIRRGELSPGQRLVEDTIANATSVSRTPVREALRRLAGTGLAVNGGRGLVVARLGAHELQQLWEVNEALWLTVARLVVERATTADVAEMTYLVEAAQSGDADAAEPIRLNERFRECLLRAAGNQYLGETVMRVVSQAESLVDLVSARRRADLMVGEVAILDAIAHRDSDAVQVAIKRHMGAVLTAALIELHAQEDRSAS